jgi:hypothetical protein
MGEGVDASGLARLRGSRRHILAIGGIAASALLARVSAARAKPKGGHDGDGGDDDDHHCFLKGTRIATAQGQRKVEDLAIGDLVPTAFGGVRPIQWIGRYSFKRRDSRKPWVVNVRPVCIKASALAANVPSADLYVTQTHRLLIDGVLITARDLINGSTISVVDAAGLTELEYYHIKLETHDVVFAEGAACETLLQIDEAAGNFVDYLRRHGAPRADEAPCAPIPSYDGARSLVKSRLRSALSPWIDRRQPLDRIRDRIEERALGL